MYVGWCFVCVCVYIFILFAAGGEKKVKEVERCVFQISPFTRNFIAKINVFSVDFGLHTYIRIKKCCFGFVGSF